MTDTFGDKMKKYERVSDVRLTERIPIIIRLDGNSFSKFTQEMKFKKPFDERFYKAMCDATTAALKYCSGAQLGYTQSDEITLLLRNDMQENTEAFLANRLEKLCSLITSTAAVHFNKSLFESLLKDQNIRDKFINVLGTLGYGPGSPVPYEQYKTDFLALIGADNNLLPEVPTATFDCRVFLVPEKEVNNAFLWRQQDAFKNCVSSVAYWGLREKYGRGTAQTMLHEKSTNERQELIFQELGINMNDYPTKYKRGVCIVRHPVSTPIEELIGVEKATKLNKLGEMVQRSIWTVDEEIPLFNQDTNYINKLLL